MIKINYHMSHQQLKKEYDKALLSRKFKDGQTAKEKFNYLKTKYPFNVIFFDVSFDKIIFVKPEDMKCLISVVKSRIVQHSKIEYIKKGNKKLFSYSVEEELREVFKYAKFQPKEITPFFTDNFNFRTCFYCNKDFIIKFRKENNKYFSTFQLDHFYDKATYPYLALSLYNFIPSCATCNSSKVKGSKDFSNIKAPNGDSFNFGNQVKFKLFLSNSCKNLNIQDKTDIEIPLKENCSNEYKDYIDKLKLNERYEAHKDIVYDMIQKAKLYPNSRLIELEKLTGISRQQIKKDIFNLISENEDLSQKPFNKLIKDMGEELGL